MSLFTNPKKKLNLDLVKDRVLTKNDYYFESRDIHKYFKLSDKVVCFYNGHDWNVILLKSMLTYPTLYFDFWVEKDNVFYENSLVLCPITLRSMIYKGKIKIIDIINDRLYLLNSDTNDEFFMDLPYTGHYDEFGKDKRIKSQVKRFEVKVLTLRDCSMFILDPRFIIIKKNDTPIISEEYYINRLTYDGLPIYTMYHPKTLVYMIQYYSFSKEKYIYIALVCKNIDKDTPTGYNYKISGVWNFIEKHKNSFVEKRAYIYPIFWFMVERLYKDAKIVLVSG